MSKIPTISNWLVDPTMFGGLSWLSWILILISAGLLITAIFKLPLPVFSNKKLGPPGIKILIGGVLIAVVVFGTPLASQLGLTGQGASIAGIPTGSNPETPSGTLQTQTSTPTAVFYAVDALNTSSGAVYRSPTVLAYGVPGVTPVSVAVSGSSGGSVAVSYGQTYTVFAQPVASTAYGDVESLNTGVPQPGKTFQMYTYAQPSITMYDVGRVQFLNSTYSTAGYINLTGASSMANISAAGAPLKFEIRYQIATAYRVFGDPRETIPVIVCTSGTTTVFDVITSASTADMPPIASGSGMRRCWTASGQSQSWLTNGDSDTGIFSAQLYLRAGQTFAAHDWAVYDKTSFLDNTGFAAAHGYNTDTGSAADVGASNPYLRVTQGTTAFTTGTIN